MVVAMGRHGESEGLFAGLLGARLAGAAASAEQSGRAGTGCLPAAPWGIVQWDRLVQGELSGRCQLWLRC